MFDFFAAQNSKLRAYVRRKIRSINDMDAEDIVEEVMLNLFAREAEAGPIENLAAYVYRSLYNKTVDYLKKASRTVPLQNDAQDDAEHPMMDRLYDSTANVNSEADRRELNHALAQAIDMLEPKQRAVFVATELMGVSFRELSEQWNEPMGTLLSRKCRAVKALQEMLKDLRAD